MTTSLITLCNKGYVPFVKNLNASLQKIESPLDLLVYCLDNTTIEILEQDNIKCRLLKNSDNNNIETEMTSFINKNSYDIYLQQFHAIMDALETNDNVIWTDSDCVFLNKALFLHLESEREYVDLLYLSDTSSSTSSYGSSGLMYIKSNNKTKEIFSLENLKKYIDEVNPPYFRPQVYLNKIIEKKLLKFKIISNKLCKSQKFIKRIVEDLYFVHYNWTTPEFKKNMMIQNGHWYIKSRSSRDAK